jgi:pyruvate,water dikinase
LSDKDLENLVAMGKRIEKHYKSPMDTEWAIENGKLYLLQSRPITTLDDNKTSGSEEVTTDLNVIIKGLGASPGIVAGPVKIIKDIEELDKIQNGDIMVTTMTTPDMVPAMKKSSGIITDEGGVTCHASIISRELGIPCVVGTGEATDVLNDGEEVSIDGKKGLVYEGLISSAENTDSTMELDQNIKAVAEPIVTVTSVKANVSMPEAAPRAAAVGADGV